MRTFRAPYAEEFIGAASRLLTPSMAFTVKHAARHSLYPPQGRTCNDAAGFASRYGPLARSPRKGFRRWASTRPVSRPSRQPATGPPGSYPDRTHTGKRRRARTDHLLISSALRSSWRTLRSR